MTCQTINRILNRNNKKKQGLPDTFRERTQMLIILTQLRLQTNSTNIL